MSRLQAAGGDISIHGPVSGLLEAVAALAALEDRRCHPQDVVQTVRHWGQRLCQRIAPDASMMNRLRMLNFFFFDELGFQGECCGGWADAGCLHRVIERRCGIALSLSILYIEIGRAIGLKLFAVEFPDGVLVKLVCTGRVLVIDLSERGVTLSVEQLRLRLGARYGAGGAGGALQQCLREVPEQDIPVRILRALKQRHQAAGRLAEALAVQSQLVQLLPDRRQELLDRADLYESLQCPRAAAQDLYRCLLLEPNAPDADAIRRRWAQARRQDARLNWH